MNKNNSRRSSSLGQYQAQHLQNLINDILDCCQEKTAYQAKKFNLTQAELKCLLLYREERYLTVKGLAQKLNVAKSRVTKIIDGLVRKKIVQRLNDPEDGRVKLIGLTADGQKQLEAAAGFLDNLHQRLLQEVKETDRKTVLHSLETLRASMEVIKSQLM